MDLRELVNAVMAGDLLTAKQFVADARRMNLRWTEVKAPIGLNATAMSLAAGLVELLATRAGSTPPAWTQSFGPIAEPMTLDPGSTRCRDLSLERRRTGLSPSVEET